MLDAGQVGAALAEVERLPGAGQAGAWVAAARRYIETRAALDAIESAAVARADQPGHLSACRAAAFAAAAIISRGRVRSVPSRRAVRGPWRR